MDRKSGSYRVKYQGVWYTARYVAEMDYWSHPDWPIDLHDHDFEEINEEMISE